MGSTEEVGLICSQFSLTTMGKALQSSRQENETKIKHDRKTMKRVEWTRSQSIPFKVQPSNLQLLVLFTSCSRQLPWDLGIFCLVRMSWWTRKWDIVYVWQTLWYWFLKEADLSVWTKFCGCYMSIWLPSSETLDTKAWPDELCSVKCLNVLYLTFWGNS